MTYKKGLHKLLGLMIRKMSFICSLSGIYDETHKKDFNDMVQLLEQLRRVI